MHVRDTAHIAEKLRKGSLDSEVHRKTLESVIASNIMTRFEDSAAYSDHVFVPRESLVTVFLQDKNFKALYSLVVCVLMVLMGCNFANYVLQPSIFWHDFDM